MISVKGAHFKEDLVLTGVRWYVADPPSGRQVEELMQERRGAVDHATINCWALKYSPQLEAAFHRCKPPMLGGGVHAPHGSAEGAGADRAIGTAQRGRRVTRLRVVQCSRHDSRVDHVDRSDFGDAAPPIPATESTAPDGSPVAVQGTTMNCGATGGGPQPYADLVAEATETLGGHNCLESAHGSLASFQAPMIVLHMTQRSTGSTLAEAGAMSAPIISRWERTAEGDAGVLPIISWHDGHP